MASSRPILSRRGGSGGRRRLRRGWILWILALGSLSASPARAQDFDGDGIADADDNCTTRANPSQLDTNADGYGNACDPDYDDDGIVGIADLRVLVQAWSSQAGDPAFDPDVDANGDGVIGGPADVLLGLYWAKPPGPSHESAPVVGPPLIVSDLPNQVPTSHEFPEAWDGGDPPQLLTYHLDECSAVYRATGLPLVGGCAVSNTPVAYDPNGQRQPFDAPTVLRPDGLLPPRTFVLWPLVEPDGSGMGVDYTITYHVEDRWGLPSARQTVVLETQRQCPDKRPRAAGSFLLSVLGDRTHAGTLPANPTVFCHSLEYYAWRFVVTTAPTEGTLDVEEFGGTFTYTPRPTAGRFDRFEYRIESVVDPSDSVQLSMHVQIFSTSGAAAYSTTELPQKALVLFNRNDPDRDPPGGPGHGLADSEEIARHYASSRGIDESRLCGLSMPPGLYATRDDLLEARRTIVEECLCPLVGDVEGCGLDTLGALADRSPVTHLVIARGVPARLYDTGWTSDDEEPSLDHYLSYLVYNDEDLFVSSTAPSALPSAWTAATFSEVSDHPNTRAWHRRELDARAHRWLAYGRVEAMDKARTMELIDRTLRAERQGFRGRMLGETEIEFAQFQNRTADFAAPCWSYVAHHPFVLGAPESTWDPTCRAATTWLRPGQTYAAYDGQVPGEPSSIPDPQDVGIFLGGASNNNGHAGFDGFPTMLEWRREGASPGCLASCDEWPTPAERASCEAASTDYFKELDTRCVGVADGFIGRQKRSYPVSYYGFFPDYWIVPPGPVDLVPAEVRSGDSFDDQHYLHLGGHDVAHPDRSTCPRPDGTTVACPEAIGIHLVQLPPIVAPDAGSGARTYRVRLRYRSQVAGPLTIHVGLFAATGAGIVSAAGTIPLRATAVWTEGSVDIPLDPGEIGAAGVEFRVTAGIRDGLRGFLDLDGIELWLLDESGAEIHSYLSRDVGSFALGDRHHATHPGDWAANAIDRLGGVGFWGSSSHHMTGGGAFPRQDEAFRKLFSGLTLGEAVTFSGMGMSGIIYGDPLYRPSAAALYFLDDSKAHERGAEFPSNRRYDASVSRMVHYLVTSGRVVTRRELADVPYLFANVMHGIDHLLDVRWSISTCAATLADPTSPYDGLDPSACAWQVRLSGTGARREMPVPWTRYFDPDVDQLLIFRLEVENPGEPQHALYDHVYVDYRADP